MSPVSLRAAACALVAVLVTACAGPDRSGSTYRDVDTRRPMAVSYGTVQAVRTVKLERNRPTGTGTAAGAVIGGVAGSTVGGGRGSIIGSVAGAVVGGVVGSHAEQSLSDRPGLELTIRDDNGRTFAVVQEAGPDSFAPGMRVRILTDSRGEVRVTP